MSSTNNYGLSGFLAGTIACVIVWTVVGCTEKKQTATDLTMPDPDFEVRGRDSMPRPDAGSNDQWRGHADAGSVDKGITRHLALQVTPSHLTSGWTSDQKVSLNWVNVGVSDIKSAEGDIRTAFSVVTFPGKSPISGKLELNAAARKGVFVPASGLIKDADYLVQVRRLGYVVPDREHTQFRVGSLPRVRRINVVPKATAPGDLDYLNLVFSEEVDRASVLAVLTVRTAKSGASLSISPIYATGASTSVAFRLPASTQMNVKLALRLGMDVGAKSGVKLDGKYTGKAGSGDFTVELTPSDHSPALGKTAWEPAIKY